MGRIITLGVTKIQPFQGESDFIFLKFGNVSKMEKNKF
jgi:hypothetical protein